ncbi:MAG: SDR family oxidoreductase [Acidimicrobiia bacterium]|nr:SDR family oxidoreductase [Acidimicrobiia bacterium]
MELGLTGRVAVVTGGGSNVGRAISLALAAEGALVVIGELDLPQGKKVVKEIEAVGGRAEARALDVTDACSVEALVDAVVDAHGGIHVWVNNVGWDQQRLFSQTDPAFWERVISLNYLSVLNCSAAVLPHMRERGQGVIVNLGSEAGRIGEPYEAVYSGAKAGVIAFSKTIAKEEGPNGIRVNAVCPGLTPATTERVGNQSMWTTPPMTDEQLERAKRFYPLRRLGTPEDVADAVVFLASDRAGYITGQTLSVSGGYTTM